MLTPQNSGLCLLCWEELNSFHKFYMRIEEAHINFGRPIKVGNKTQILDKAISSDKEDDKDLIQYGLLEPEILINKSVEKKEVEMLFTRKIEPQDESYADNPIEDESVFLATGNDLSNKDPLKKSTKTRNKTIKRKIETKYTSNFLSKINKLDTIEIKRENPKNDEDGDKNENIKADDNSDSDNSSDNDDSSCKTKCKKRKNYYKHRTNRLEIDQFIDKHLKDIVCELCKTNFETYAALRQHFSSIHKQKGYVICCNKKLFNRTRLVDHIQFHLNPDHLKCGECGRVMSDSIHLERHMVRFHGATALEKKYCDVCQKPFIDDYRLRNHKLTHLPDEEKKFPCQECGKLLVLILIF